MLHIEDLTKGYGKVLVIRALSVSFPVGLHIIAGDNGAGKTTLFKCIASLERYRGSILWDGGSVRNHLAASFDDSPAHGGLTGLQNLSAMLDVPVRQLRNNASTFRFLPKDRLERKVKSFSLGPAQKAFTHSTVHGHRPLRAAR